MKPVYLFSIDLEDVRFAMPDGAARAERVPAMTARYLGWLARKGLRITFFVCGDVAEAYPSLVRDIAAAGHELGCHTMRHVPIDRQTPDEFRRDLAANVEALRRAGAPAPRGFRAPIFSLTAASAWAYGVLRELGFSYSSSVLPARNPFWCWPEFGPGPRAVDGIVEIPMTVRRFAHLVVPPAGGVYLRALPKWWILRSARKTLRSGRPLVGYCHPYDIDDGQERFMMPDIDDSRFYNFLMYYNRKKVFRRLEAILDLGFAVMPYADYVEAKFPGAATRKAGAGVPDANPG